MAIAEVVDLQDGQQRSTSRVRHGARSVSGPSAIGLCEGSCGAGRSGARTSTTRSSPICGSRGRELSLASPTKLLKASDQMRLNQSDRDFVSNRDLHAN